MSSLIESETVENYLYHTTPRCTLQLPLRWTDYLRSTYILHRRFIFFCVYPYHSLQAMRLSYIAALAVATLVGSSAASPFTPSVEKRAVSCKNDNGKTNSH